MKDVVKAVAGTEDKESDENKEALLHQTCS